MTTELTAHPSGIRARVAAALKPVKERRRSVRGMWPAVCLGFASAFGGQAHGDGPGADATPVDLAHCLEAARNQAELDEERCLGFIVQALAGGFGALAQCDDVGGTLAANPIAAARAIDVNCDGRPEYLFELSNNFTCDGAPSLFSCGSLGCPSILYERRDGQWHVIGALAATIAQGIEVLPREGAADYRPLRVGCDGRGGCDEYVHYEWNGAGYEQVAREVRGFWVDVAGSVHGLRTLQREAAVLDAPVPDGRLLARYPAGTEVAVIGRARGAPYYYVSPCNACENGFLAVGAAVQETAR